MVGENGDVTLTEEERARYRDQTGEEILPDDPRALSKKPIWQRMIIIAAGGVTNILIGIILTFAMVLSMPALGSTVVAEFAESAASNVGEQALMKDDIILKINDTRVSTHMMLAYQIMHDGDKPVNITVVRGAELIYNEEGEYVSYSGGEEIILTGVEFPKIGGEGVDEALKDSDAAFGDMDFSVYRIEKSAGVCFSQSAEYSRMMVKTVWDSIFDLIRGRYGVEALSGPVGVSSEIGTAAKGGPSSLLYIIVLLSVNLGIINLLPIPALDGGHLLFLFIELIRRKPIDPELKGKINGIALMLLFALAIFIMFKDIVGLFR